MRFLLSSILLILLSQAPAALASIFCAAQPDANGHITIPNTWTSISGAQASGTSFSGCQLTVTVTIPDSVTSLGSHAFYNNRALTSVTIGNSVTSIGELAFYNCISLTSVTIGNSVTSIGKSAFTETALTSVTIPDSVTSIGESAFKGLTTLTSVTIENSVTSIGKKAFMDTTGLTSIAIGNSVTSIGERAFSGSGLTSITIPDSVTSISKSAFYGSGLTSITIPDSVTSIGDTAFARSALTNVTIPASVTSIEGAAFINMPNLKSITFMSSDVTINNNWYGTGILNQNYGNDDPTPLYQICGVDVTVAPFNGMDANVDQTTQEQCTEPVCPVGVSGVKWCLDHTTCGNQVDGTTTRLTGASSTEVGTCADCDSGSFAASATEDCTAYRTTCPDNEYLSLDGTATSDHSCIPCAADEKSYGGAPCKKIVDCLSATEQGHRNIDVGFASGDYTVSMS